MTTLENTQTAQELPAKSYGQFAADEYHVLVAWRSILDK